MPVDYTLIVRSKSQPGVCHPVEDAAHVSGMSVVRASIDYELTMDRVLMFVEGEGQKGGLLDPRQVCVGGSKTMGVDKNLNVCQPEGGKMCVFASLEIFAGSTEE